MDHRTRPLEKIEYQIPVVTARAIITTYQTAAFAALTEWAVDGADGVPADAMDAMLRRLIVASDAP
jgi:hypothetical protein